MPATTTNIVVVGAGVLGVCAARELRQRGHAVRLLEQGPLPHSKAASFDISKAVRADYGADRFYTKLMIDALTGWRAWNSYFGETLFHETGFLFLSHELFKPGGYEYDSIELLTELGFALERLDAGGVAARYPAWHNKAWPAAYLNPAGGWVDAELTLRHLIAESQRIGVEILPERRMKSLIEEGGAVRGVVDSEDQYHVADLVLVAAGAWTPVLLPQLRGMLRVTGQPVVHFQLEDSRSWKGPTFPPWTADISTTGWYGFPANSHGILKVANHGPGRPVDPDGTLELTEAETALFRRFMHETFGELETASIARARLRPYCDTRDGDFWIDHDPDLQGLMVAAGGSGHAFKFAPVMGGIIADIAEHRSSQEFRRFRWRGQARAAHESARHA